MYNLNCCSVLFWRPITHITVCRIHEWVCGVKSKAVYFVLKSYTGGINEVMQNRARKRDPAIGKEMFYKRGVAQFVATTVVGRG